MEILYVCGYDCEIVGGVQKIVPEYFENIATSSNVYVWSFGKHGLNVKNKNYELLLDKKRLNEVLNRVEVVVFHEVYYLQYPIFANKLRKMNIPYIVIPHGSLTKGAQTQKRFIKQVFNTCFINRFIREAVSIQFLSEYEEKQSRTFKYNHIIIPNGIIINENCFSEKLIPEKGMRMVFIGRLSVFYKGLDLLIEACNCIKSFMRKNDISLEIYGPDFEGGKAKIIALIKEYEITDIVKVSDGVFGETKDLILKLTDIFIQPSRSEGQPMGILEAMQYKLPLIITPGTTFGDLVINYKLGWCVEGEPTIIAEGIKKAYSEKDKWIEYGNNELNILKNRFVWPMVVNETIRKYKQLI